MKIIFVNRYFYPDHSATSQMLSDLAFGIADKGIEVHIITSRQQYNDPAAELPPFQNVNNVNVQRVATTRFGRNATLGRMIDYLSFYSSATWALLRKTDHSTLVITKTDPPLISIAAAIVCKLRNGRLINWLQDLFPEVAIALRVPGTNGVLGRLLTRLRNWSLQKAVCNVVIGDNMRDKLLEIGVADKKIVVIHNWADGDAIQPTPKECNPLREKWSLQRKFVIGYSGNLGRAHEFETILDAIKKLQYKTDITLLIIGAGAQAEEVKSACIENNLTNVQFRPYQPRERLSLSLSVADVHLVILKPELEGLIVPSKYYGIIAADRPVIFIGSPDGEITRMIQANKNGSQINIGDSDRLAELIIDIQTQPENAWKGKSRQSFETHYAFPIALEKWLALINDHKPPPSIH